MRQTANGRPGAGMLERFAGLGSKLATVMFVLSMLRPFLPRQLFDHFLGRFARRCSRRVVGYLDPYVTITVSEGDGDRMKSSGEVYEQAKAYVSHRGAGRARSLRAERARGSDQFVLTMGDSEEVVDEYRGATVWWRSVASSPARRAGYFPPPNAAAQDVVRSYRLVFHERHRELVVDSYLPHVYREGRAIMVRNRRRKLFTNTGDKYKSLWGHVALEHPSTFETLAMDPAKKREIMDDLDAFRNGKDYYDRVGKAWKRGYLLYGPPGTGKSTMIAAMANYLDYDIYDVELTSVATNIELRRLFIETKSKSIVVVEDIDCSVDLTGKRKKTKPPPGAADHDAGHGGKVTLSGLLNVIDGLWSACGGERIVIFTTNYIDKLDPALIRRGRMDKHIEMSYCCFESFKLLAKNYLGIDAHPLFDEINVLLQDAKVTPADVAEHLMPRRVDGEEDSCLPALVMALQEAKEKAMAKKEQEEIVDHGETALE